MTFTDILDALGVPYLTEGHHHCRAGWVQIDCPFCGKGSGRYHMGYSIKGRYLSCWRCRGHSVVSTLIEASGESADKIKRLVKDMDNGLPLKKEETKRGELKLPAPLEPLTQAHRDYLRERGFSVRELKELWGIRGLGPLARVKTPEGVKIKLSWRVFIPIRYNHETVSWTTRTIQKSNPQRYVSAPASCEAVPHKTLLYGEDYAHHAVCCVEGPFDVWKIGPGAVGTCGTGFSRAQVLKLSRYNVRAVCFDNEPDAQKRARELVSMLSVFPGETYNIVLDAKDAAEASDREIAKLRKAIGL